MILALLASLSFPFVFAASAKSECVPLAIFTGIAQLDKSSVQFMNSVGSKEFTKAEFNSQKCKNKKLSKESYAKLRQEAADGEKVLAVIDRGCLVDVRLESEITKLHASFKRDSCAKTEKPLIQMLIGWQTYYVNPTLADWLRSRAGRAASNE